MIRVSRKTFLNAFGTIVVASILALVAFVAAHRPRAREDQIREWIKLLEPLDNPDRAKRQIPNLTVIRFGYDQWVMGFCRSGAQGAIVVKDSKNRIRVFIGKVEAPGFLEAHSYLWYLDQFYATLTDEGLTESLDFAGR
jgi:hypothetical protein